MSADCLFCKIIQGQIPSKKVFENDHVYAFKDINPQAQVHVLFVHKKHTGNINQLTQEDPQQLSQVFSAMAQYSVQENLNDKGFRIVTNQGKNAGQTVFHTHFHFLGGEALGHFGAP
jgi:histidine triad (HIT) family protein